MFEIVLQ